MPRRRLVHRNKPPVKYFGKRDLNNFLIVYEGRILGFVKLISAKIICRKDGRWTNAPRWLATSKEGEEVAIPDTRDAAARYLIEFKETGEKP